MLALVLAAAVGACGGNDDDEGAGGSGGAVGAMGGAAGQAGGSGNVVTAKFCNVVGFGEEGNPMPITLRLDIGTAPNIVSFSTLTDTCTPMDGMACTEIPAGTDIPVGLVDPEAGEDPIALATLTSMPGQEWIIIADADAQGDPFIDAELVPAGNCSDTTYDDVFPRNERAGQ